LFKSIASTLVAAFLSVAPASAEPHFKNGVELYGLKRYQGAVEEFELAYKETASSAALYYQALCYSQLRDFVRAKQLYEIIVQRFPGTQEAKLAATGLQGLAAAAPKKAPQAAASGAPEHVDQEIAMSMRGRDMSVTDDEWNKLPDRGDLPFRRGRGGHLFVDVQVNGRTIQAIFDTGAELCLFGKNNLQQVGVTPVLVGPKGATYGVGSKVHETQTMIADLSMGGIKRHMPITVMEEAEMPLIGQTFFGPFQYDIDSSAGVIHFVKRPRGGGKARIADRLDTIDIPFERHGNEIVVNVKINGRDIPMYFDTGAAHNFLTASQAFFLGLRIPSDAEMVMAGGIGGAVRAYQFYVDRMELGPILKTHVQILVAESGPPIPLLGQPFFGDKRFTIDNDNSVIHFMR
jgi:clan AA aspartic protease (TIGR02281 family)